MSRNRSGSSLHALLSNRAHRLLVQILFQVGGFPLNLVVEALQVYLKEWAGQQQSVPSSQQNIGAAVKVIAPLNQWRWQL